MSSLVFEWPKLPVSVNNLYFTRGRMRTLTTAARGYKREFVAKRGGLPAHELMQFEIDTDGAYVLEMWFYLPPEMLYNKSFGKRKGTPRYKKLDVSNFIKLLEDAISELLGLEDRNNLSVLAHKRESLSGFSGVVAKIGPLNLEEDPYALH